MIYQVGQQIGNYRLVEPLGKGSFAQVWRGEHIHLQLYAALKILTELDTKAQQMFLKEAKIIKNFSHPHIIKLFDYTIENNIPVIIMDYAPKGTLANNHPKGQIVPLTKILEYLKPIASALDYAHKQGIIHRDIKPENILIGSNNEILISDFGIASTVFYAQTKWTGRSYAGTLCYSAPEQIEGNPCPASDQHAVGVMVYQWLSGSLPFNFISLHETPVPLCQKVPTISSTVEAVVMKALAKDPTQRFESVWKFAKALELAVNQPSLSTLTVLAPSTVQASSAMAPTVQKSPVVQPSPASAPTVRVPQNPFDTPLLVYRGHNNAPGRTCAWSPDGIRLATGGSNGLVKIWNAVTGQQLLTCQDCSVAPINAVAWSPDGSRLASASDDWTVRVWDARSGSLLLSYTGHSDKMRAVAWSPNSTHLASASEDKAVQIWDAQHGTLLRTYTGHFGQINAVAWSPDGSCLASASSDGTVQVWNAGSGTLLRTYTGHSGEVLAVVWSPDGTYLASASKDKTVHVWDACSGVLQRTYTGHSSSVNGVAWSPDRNCLASASSDKTAQIWDAQSGTLLHTCTGHADEILAVIWSSDGNRLASASKNNEEIRVWDTRSGTLLRTYGGHTPSPYINVQAVAWSPDGNRLASASWDKTVQIWDPSSGALLHTYRGHSDHVNALAWSPDGSRLASASWDKTVQIWDARSGTLQRTYTGHDDYWGGGAGSGMVTRWKPSRLGRP